MTYLLDTNTCIGWLRENQPQIVARIQAQTQTDIVLCSVVMGELLFGVERSDPAQRANTGMRVDQLRQQFMSLPFDDAAAEQYGRIRADLTGRGLLICHTLRLKSPAVVRAARPGDRPQVAASRLASPDMDLPSSNCRRAARSG